MNAGAGVGNAGAHAGTREGARVPSGGVSVSSGSVASFVPAKRGIPETQEEIEELLRRIFTLPDDDEPYPLPPERTASFEFSKRGY